MSCSASHKHLFVWCPLQRVLFDSCVATVVVLSVISIIVVVVVIAGCYAVVDDVMLSCRKLSVSLLRPFI